MNASEFTLLPGEANVFMDDNFVSKTRIEVRFVAHNPGISSQHAHSTPRQIQNFS